MGERESDSDSDSASDLRVLYRNCGSEVFVYSTRLRREIVSFCSSEPASAPASGTEKGVVAYEACDPDEQDWETDSDAEVVDQSGKKRPPPKKKKKKKKKK